MSIIETLLRPMIAGPGGVLEIGEGPWTYLVGQLTEGLGRRHEVMRESYFPVRGEWGLVVINDPGLVVEEKLELVRRYHPRSGWVVLQSDFESLGRYLEVIRHCQPFRGVRIEPDGWLIVMGIK